MCYCRNITYFIRSDNEIKISFYVTIDCVDSSKYFCRLVNNFYCDWFPCCSRSVGSLVAACRTSVLETGELFSGVSCTSPSMLFLPSAPLTVCFSACRTWFRYSGAPGLPGGSGELEWCSGLLPVEGQETPYWGGVGVGCTWRAARYTVCTLKT